MSSPSRPEFGLLDLEGKEYHRWVSDMELAFESRGIEGMFADPPADFPPMAKTQTLIFMRRHIHATLKRQYLNVKDPKELWDKLRLRYNNVHDKLLPELTVRWDNIRLLDYKRVDDFNQDMLCLQSDLGTVGVIKTDLDLLNKTLDTFPINYEVQAHTYRTHVEEGKIRSFADLMALLAKKERHSEILLNNNNRPVGGKICNLSSYWNSREMSNSEYGGTKFASRSEKFQEQPTFQQSLKGGRLVRIPTQVCGRDMLAHTYSIIEKSLASESDKFKEQTLCSKNDESREGTIEVGEFVQRNVSRGELYKPLKDAPIRFDNFHEDLNCMQVAAMCVFEGKSYCPRVKFECFSNLAISSYH
ncbi:uncharacterized protein LOC126803689 [Argentina anserina]|uniref:uncharacterized protein LOC126803689 n=1 Tax=Argentina anserina TaxID=57926 RepID=UPI00217678DD|nr:uncharacterized protein LOC126803689 [Potentilla anserina]